MSKHITLERLLCILPKGKWIVVELNDERILTYFWAKLFDSESEATATIINKPTKKTGSYEVHEGTMINE